MPGIKPFNWSGIRKGQDFGANYRRWQRSATLPYVLSSTLGSFGSLCAFWGTVILWSIFRTISVFVFVVNAEESHTYPGKLSKRPVPRREGNVFFFLTSSGRIWLNVSRLILGGGHRSQSGLGDTKSVAVIRHTAVTRGRS